MNKTESVAARLKYIMNQRGLKQVDVLNLARPYCEKYNVKLAKNYLSQYCSGKNKPGKDILNVLSLALDVNPAWLQGFDVPQEFSGAESSIKEDISKNRYNRTGDDNSGKKTDTTQASATDFKNNNSADICKNNKTSDNNTNNNSRNNFNSDKPSDNSEKGYAKMKTLKKSSKLDNVLYDVRGPVLDEANRMEAEGSKILKLNIGNPAPFGFEAPEEVLIDMRHELEYSQGYSDSKGIYTARKAIMQYAQLKNIPNVTINDIYTGNGVSELINLCMQALLNNGDEILIPSPDYPLWTATATLAGGKAVHYICDEQSEWYPDIEDMRNKITDKTKAIVIINPNNPTGALYPKEILEQIVELAREHQLMIFSDEIYDRLVMDGEKHISIASLAPDLFCITFSGLSKSHMIAGFRIGWMILSGRKDIAKDYIEGLNMLSNMRLCSNVPAQSIVQTALGGYQSVETYIQPGGRIFEQRDFIYKALNDIPGVSAVKPKAAFYIFPKLDIKKFNILNDEKFAIDFLREKKVLIVPGSGFNWESPDHFRVVYLPQLSVLEKSMEGLKDFLSHYRQ